MTTFWKTIVVLLSLQTALNAWLVNSAWERLDLVTDVVIEMASDLYDEDFNDSEEEPEPAAPEWEI